MHMQRFSTDDVPQHDRLAVVHDFVARHVAGRQFSLLDPEDTRIEFAVCDLPGGTMVGAASYPPIFGERDGELLADGRDDYLLTVHSEEHEASVDGGQSFTVPAGDLLLIHEGTRSDFRLPRTCLKAVSFGRARLAARVPRVDRQAFYHIPRSAPAAALIAGYADLLREQPPLGDRAGHTAADHLHDLMAIALEAFVKVATGGSRQGIRAARLELVKKAMLGRLCDPQLSIASVAGSQGITPRYVHRLFEADGTTFSEFLRDSRLDLALRLLREAPDRSSIAAIAFDAGFHDLSNFNRSFRRRFGATPSDIRADAMRKRGGRHS